MEKMPRDGLRQVAVFLAGLCLTGLAQSVQGLAPRLSEHAGAPMVDKGVSRPLSSQSARATPQDWSVEHGRLRPGKALRARFDRFLPVGQGVTLVDVRAALERQALPVLGRPITDEVLAVWDGYARLQSHLWRHPWVERQPQSWAPALAEQKLVRRQLLGEAWAQAFFGEEEAHQGRLIQAEQGLSVDDPAWVLRSQAAQRHWQSLQDDASLHEGERLLLMRHYLQGHHSAAEIERLSSKLDLP